MNAEEQSNAAWEEMEELYKSLGKDVQKVRDFRAYCEANRIDSRKKVEFVMDEWFNEYTGALLASGYARCPLCGDIFAEIYMGDAEGAAEKEWDNDSVKKIFYGTSNSKKIVEETPICPRCMQPLDWD